MATADIAPLVKAGREASEAEYLAVMRSFLPKIQEQAPDKVIPALTTFLNAAP